jgi:hypothetical protein
VLVIPDGPPADFGDEIGQFGGRRRDVSLVGRPRLILEPREADPE